MDGLAGGAGKKLIEWVRWLHAMDGIGPKYCETVCKEAGVPTPCDQCPAPEVLPEQLEALTLYDAVSTQWRRGPSGAVTGLDYAGVESLMRVQGLRGETRRELFAALRVMERETLNVSRELARRDGDTN